MQNAPYDCPVARRTGNARRCRRVAQRHVRRPGRSPYHVFIAFLSSLVAGIWFAVAFDPSVHYFFSRMYVVDSFASLMKAVVTLGYAVTIVYSRRYLEDRGLFAASSSCSACSRCSVSS